MNTVYEVIHGQIRDNQRLNLFFQDLEDEIVINKNFKNKVLEVKQDCSIDISEMVELATRVAIDQLFTINQYLQLSSRDKEDLKALYFHTYSSVDHHNFEREIKVHFKALSSWIGRFYPDNFSQSLRNMRRIGHVISNEYTVQFLTEIFDLDLNTIQEPVIDIGCGKNAALVRDLIRKNKTVVGIDRLIEYSGDGVLEINWFDFDFGNNKWGTVIANMSFTNHLLYAFRHNAVNMCDYYLKYKEIIEALIVNGCFYYAPSLEFIEDRLDSTYSVERKNMNGTSITKLVKTGIMDTG